jgi:colanic acid/amylovoran biosynthesis glycosyltransferase
MKIIFCANHYQSRIVGPAILTEMLLKINDWYPEHEIRILTEDVAESSEKIYKLTTNYPRPIHALDIFLRNFSYKNALKRIYKEYPFDVVVFGYASFGVATKHWLSPSVKVVGFINDYFRLKANLRHVEWSKDWLFYFVTRQVERYAVFRLDKIIACSHYLSRYLIEEYNCPARKIYTLYQSIDVENIEFSLHRAFVSPYKILFVKSYIYYGALDILSKALSQLSDFTFELTVICPLSAYNKAIQELFRNSPNVQLTILSSVNKESLYAQMAAHDILCVPSRIEALGIINIEGLATGISVVSTHEGGIPEVLNQGENGWLAAPENAESLAEALRNCIEATPSVREQKSLNGRRFIEQNFNIKTLIDQFLDICEKEK